MARAIILAAAEEERARNAVRLERKLIRDTSDPMSLPDKQFIDYFRLQKNSFAALVEELTPHLKTKRRGTAVPHQLKVTYLPKTLH